MIENHMVVPVADDEAIDDCVSAQTIINQAPHSVVDDYIGVRAGEYYDELTDQQRTLFWVQWFNDHSMRGATNSHFIEIRHRVAETQEVRDARDRMRDWAVAGGEL